MPEMVIKSVGFIYIYAAAGIRTRVRGYFPPFIIKGCWEAPVITAGPQPHYFVNIGSSNILFMVSVP
jgi:hypothetical protein